MANMKAPLPNGVEDTAYARETMQMLVDGLSGYDLIEAEVRALAMSLSPSDLGSTRAIQAVAMYVFRKLNEKQE